MVQKASGKFEVTEGNAPVMSGSVRVPTNVSHEMVALEPPRPIVIEDLLEFSSQDIYKYLRLCGYEYEGLFCGLVCADNHGEYHSMLYYMNSFSLFSLAVIHIVQVIDYLM
jgi:fatty acid synthase